MIIKQHRRQAYTVIDNGPVRDDRLSWRATGLLVFLLSLPPDWRISTERLARGKTDGLTATRSAMSELEAAGYVKRTKIRNERGHWTTITHVAESPDLLDESVDQPTLDLPTSALPKLGEADSSRKTEDELLSDEAKRNPYWDALESLFGYRPEGNEARLWGRLAQKVKRDLDDATPLEILDEVVLRAGVYLRRFTTPLTPAALDKHWSWLGSRIANLDDGTREKALDEARRRARREELLAGTPALPSSNERREHI